MASSWGASLRLIPKEYSGCNRGTYHMTPKQGVFRVVDMYTSGIYIQLADTRILPWFIPVRNEGSGTFSTKWVERRRIPGRSRCPSSKKQNATDKTEQKVIMEMFSQLFLQSTWFQPHLSTPHLQGSGRILELCAKFLCLLGRPIFRGYVSARECRKFKEAKLACGLNSDFLTWNLGGDEPMLTHSFSKGVETTT